MEWNFPKINTVTFIGAGYVGGPTSAVLADNCPHLKILVTDMNKGKINQWTSSKIPIFEPGLEEIVTNCLGDNLFFTADVESAIDEAELIFICVNTPVKMFGSGQGMAPDLRNLENVARLIARCSTRPKIVVEKSTVPVHAAASIQAILKEAERDNSNIKFAVLSNPEFMSEGTAIRDLHRPERVLIGGSNTPEGHAAVEALIGVYANWVPHSKILTTNTWSAELSKLAANAFLAQRISSINSISAICEATGADVQEVSKAIGMDKRIGNKFLDASIGFGGTCFTKDVHSLVYLAESLNLEIVANYWKRVVEMNAFQRERFAVAMVKELFNTVANKPIAIFGFSYKKDTGDTRDSSAISVISHLLEEQAIIHIYDPRVPKHQILYDIEQATNRKKVGNVTVFSNPHFAAEKTHAIAILTEWEEFKNLDYAAIYKTMQHPASIFDGRLMLDKKALRGIGFRVHAIGSSPAEAYNFFGKSGI